MKTTPPAPQIRPAIANVAATFYIRTTVKENGMMAMNSQPSATAPDSIAQAVSSCSLHLGRHRRQR